MLDPIKQVKSILDFHLDTSAETGNAINIDALAKALVESIKTVELTKVIPINYAPCPLCKQYSHSIHDDKLTDVYLHFHTMICNNPMKGYPTGHMFSAETRDAANVLLSLKHENDHLRKLVQSFYV